MKKILVLLSLVFVCTNLTAQTGKDIIQSCITSMRLDKLDSVMTVSAKAYLYQQSQKTTIRYFNKDYGDGTSENSDSKIRIELSSMGKEDAFVIADDEFFRVVPNYEELDPANMGQLQQLMGWMFPTFSIISIVKDTVDAAIFTLQEGTTKFNDKNCKKISIASKEKPEEIIQYIFFDESTNWFQGVEIPTEQGIIGLTCSSFKKAKGHVYPTTIKLLNDGKKLLEVEIDKLEFDISLEDSLFERKK